MRPATAAAWTWRATRLLAERRRFPDSPRSLDAAFLLGRVEEASDRGLARAIEWYDEYLTRAPAGTYASEALGRKMTLTSKLEGAVPGAPDRGGVSPALPRRHVRGAGAGVRARALNGTARGPTRARRRSRRSGCSRRGARARGQRA